MSSSSTPATRKAAANARAVSRVTTSSTRGRGAGRLSGTRYPTDASFRVPVDCDGKFLDYATTDARFGALYELIAATGLRRGEAVGLRWPNVDLAAGGLFVREQLVGLNVDHGKLPACPYCGGGTSVWRSAQ